MICCNDCGEVFESRRLEDILQVFDEHKNTWVTVCPYCGSDDLFEEDFLNEDYFEKPVNLDKLPKRIHNCLEKRVLILQKRSQQEVGKILQRIWL